MTLAEFMMEGLIKDEDKLKIVKTICEDVTAVRRGNWFQDHMLDFSEDEVIAFQWDKKNGWKITVTDPAELPFC